MAVVTFDTLKFVKTLEAAGVPAPQAEAFSTAVRDSHEAAELATKADLRQYESAIRNDLEKLDMGLRKDMQAMETGLRKDMQAMESRFEAKLSDIKFELLKWVIGIGIAQLAAILGLLLKLMH